MNSSPNFTAFMVARTLLALRATLRGRGLVDEEAASYYQAFVNECEPYGGLFRLVARLPDKLLLLLLDRLIVRGMPEHYACRKRAIALHASRVLEAGVKQMIVVGGGFDLLSLRMAREFPGIKCFEIDHPDTQKVKLSALQVQLQNLPGNCHFIACDLAQHRLFSVLSGCEEFAIGAPTLFVTESVSMYLTEEQNQQMLADMQQVSLKQADLLFTAVDKLDDGSDAGESIRDWFLSRRKERFSWGLPLEKMEIFLNLCGFRLNEHLRYADLQKDIRTPAERAMLDSKNGEHLYIAKSTCS